MNSNQILATFPQKLYNFIQDEEGKSVYWAKHGCAFYISDNNKLCEVLPNYFKLTKLTSFQRQLNLYGFRRLTKGEDQGAYFHPKFQRHRKDLLNEVYRLPGKGSLSSLDQVLNNPHHNPITNTTVVDHDHRNITKEIQSNKQNTANQSLPIPSLDSNKHVKLSLNQQTEINKHLKQTKSMLTKNLGYLSVSTSSKSSTVEPNKSTVPSSALCLNDSQYQKIDIDERIATNHYQSTQYYQQQSTNIHNQQSYDPYQISNSNNIFNPFDNPSNGLYSNQHSNYNHTNNISSNNQNNMYYDNYNNIDYSRNNNDHSHNNNYNQKSNDMNSYGTSSNYFNNISNHDRNLLLDDLIEFPSDLIQKKQGNEDLNYVVQAEQSQQLNSKMKDNLLSAFIDDNEECTNK